MDLNHRPLGYEPNEHSRLLYPAVAIIIIVLVLKVYFQREWW